MKNIFVTFLVVLAIAFIAKDKLIPAGKKELTIAVPYAALTQPAKLQVECLTQNIFFEAGAEPITGQLAVAMVTMKRVKHRWAKDVCGVVRQKINSTCQFSWWCDGKLQQKAVKYEYSPAERARYNNIRKVAMMAFLNYGEIDDPTRGATFYHATYVDPKWKLRKTTQIGNHIFYRRS